MLVTLFIVIVLLIAVIITNQQVRAWEKRLSLKFYENGKIAYTAKGQVEYSMEGKGPVVLFIHGSLGGYDQGKVYLDALLENSAYTRLSISRPSYGRTPSCSNYAEAADVIAALLDALKIDKVAVSGTSGGGATLVEFALRHSKRCWALVPISCATKRKRYVPTFVERMMMNSFFFWLMHFFPISSRKSILKGYEPKSNALDDPKRLKIADSLVQTLVPPNLRVPGTLDEGNKYAEIPIYPVKQISIPTLVVHGKIDPEVSFDDALFLSDNIPHAEHYWVENGGHVPILSDDYENVKKRVQTFLKQHAPVG